MKFNSSIDDYDILHERLNWLQNQIEELQSKVEIQETSTNNNSSNSTITTTSSTAHQQQHQPQQQHHQHHHHHRIINDKNWKAKRRRQFVDSQDIKPAAIILTRSILQFLSPGPVSEKDLRISTANRCKDLGVKITGKGGVAGDSMDVFTVCNVLQAIGVLEDATIPPPPPMNPIQKDSLAAGLVNSESSADTMPPQPGLPFSPRPHTNPNNPNANANQPLQPPPPPPLNHLPEISKPSSSSIPTSTPLTPNQSISLLSTESPDRPSISGPCDRTQILRSSTPIIPISFDQIGECLTPINSTPSLSNISNPFDHQSIVEEKIAPLSVSLPSTTTLTVNVTTAAASTQVSQSPSTPITTAIVVAAAAPPPPSLPSPLSPPPPPPTPLSSTSTSSSSPALSYLQTAQARAAYGVLVETSLTARWEKQLREYLKDLRCRKISHIMGRESYPGGGTGTSRGGGGSSSKIQNSGSGSRSLATAASSSTSILSLQSQLLSQLPNTIASIQSSSLDEEDFEDDDDIISHSQSNTSSSSTPLGIAVTTNLNIVVPPTTPLHSKQSTSTTPRDSNSSGILSKGLSSPSGASPLQTALLSPTSANTASSAITTSTTATATSHTTTAAAAAAATTTTTPTTKGKKPAMRRFTGSTRGGWTFPNPLPTANELGVSQYDIFHNPQEVLTKWSQVCYEEGCAEEYEECLLRQIAAECGLSLPLEPYRIGTHYLTSDYRVSLTKTRSGSFSQIPGEHLSGSRPRSTSRSSSTGNLGVRESSQQKSTKLQNNTSQNEGNYTTTSLIPSSPSQPPSQTQTQNIESSTSLNSVSPSYLSQFKQTLLMERKKNLIHHGGIYDETTSNTASSLIEKAKKNQSGHRGKIFQKKPKFDETTGSNYFSFSEHVNSNYLTSPRHNTTPLPHPHGSGSQTPVDPPSSRKRSRSGSSLLSQFPPYSTSSHQSNSSSSSSSRPYCPIMFLYDSLYRASDSTNTDQSAGPDVCPITGRLSLIDIIVNTRPIPWIDIAKQFTILQIDDYNEIGSTSQLTYSNDEISSSKSPLHPIGHNLNGSIGTWVDIRVPVEEEKEVNESENQPTVVNNTEETKAKERRGRKKLSHNVTDEEERRPKRLQRHSSSSSLQNYMSEEERKNYRQEFRRVSFADVIAPSFREISNYEDIYCQHNHEVVVEEEEQEDISDEAIAKRHEDTLKRMREKWAIIQELKDSLKRSSSISSFTSTDRHHHFSSPRQNYSNNKSFKSPRTPKDNKFGRRNGGSFGFGQIRRQKSTPLISSNGGVSAASGNGNGRESGRGSGSGSGGNSSSNLDLSQQKKRRGRQRLQRSLSDSPTVGTGTSAITNTTPAADENPPPNKTRRSRGSSLIVEPSITKIPSFSKKRNVKEITSETKAADDNSTPPQPRKRGRPPKYHPQVPPPAPLPSSSTSSSSSPPPLHPPPPPSGSVPEKSEKSPRKALSEPINPSLSSSPFRFSPNDSHHSLEQFQSTSDDEGLNQILSEHLLADKLLPINGPNRHHQLHNHRSHSLVPINESAIIFEDAFMNSDEALGTLSTSPLLYDNGLDEIATPADEMSTLYHHQNNYKNKHNRIEYEDEDEYEGEEEEEEEEEEEGEGLEEEGEGEGDEEGDSQEIQESDEY